MIYIYLQPLKNITCVSEEESPYFLMTEYNFTTKTAFKSDKPGISFIMTEYNFTTKTAFKSDKPGISFITPH